MSEAGFQRVVGGAGAGAWSLGWGLGEMRGGGAPRWGWRSRSRSLLPGSWWFGMGLCEK